jgi:hypothetical protein
VRGISVNIVSPIKTRAYYCTAKTIDQQIWVDGLIIALDKMGKYTEAVGFF